MEKINIEPLTPQSFTFNKNNYRYDITIRLADNEILCSISIDEQSVIDSFRVTVGELLLPYEYQEKDGNFVLSMPDDELPDYEQFGQSQNLYWLTAEETKAVRDARD